MYEKSMVRKKVSHTRFELCSIDTRFELCSIDTDTTHEDMYNL